MDKVIAKASIEHFRRPKRTHRSVLPLSPVRSYKRRAAVVDALAQKFPGRIVICHGGGIETSSDFERFLKAEPRLHRYGGSQLTPLLRRPRKALRKFHGWGSATNAMQPRGNHMPSHTFNINE